MKDKILIFWKQYSYLIMIAALLVGMTHPMVTLIFIICMMGPALTGFFSGRFWCGSICPIGNFFDSQTIRISKKNKVPKIFKSIWVKIIAAVIMMTMFIHDMSSAWGNANKGGLVYFEMIMESIIVGTILALLYNHRVWCHFCPMGSMGAIVAKFSKKKKVLEVSTKCTSCKTCNDNCPMGVETDSFKGTKIISADCIQCGKCIEICPQKAVSYGKLNSQRQLALEKYHLNNGSGKKSLEKILEEKLVVSVIFTLVLMILSTEMVNYHFLSTISSAKIVAVLKLILTSIIMLTCVDLFQFGLTSLLKASPNIYSVISVGILAWYVYQILIVYLIIAVNAAYLGKLNFMLIAVVAAVANIVRYLEFTGKLTSIKTKINTKR